MPAQKHSGVRIAESPMAPRQHRLLVPTLMLITALLSATPVLAKDATDWITSLPREPVHVAAWPGGKKVAVCFVLYVEVWGFGHGPSFRSDMLARDPDIVDESFRQSAINWGVSRVGWLFNEEGVPLSIALSALVPNAPIIAPAASTTPPNCCRSAADAMRRNPTSAAHWV
jgi:hypothetical protein